jgi:hypothetical protein
MIAIVILGLGLLVVATMFPIAWTKTRDQAEFTAAITCATSASNTVPLVTRISGPNPFGPPPYTLSSFFGDLDETGAGVDPWVHALHVQNLIIDAPTLPAPDSPLPLYGDFADPNAVLGPDNADYYLNPVAPGIPPIAYQIAFQDRVYPPLPTPPDPAVLPGPQLAQALARWRELLSQRRFCWAVLHKLNYDATAVPPQAPGPTDRRSFTMYYVTLRRGQPTHRFARQDNTLGAISPYVDPGNITGTLPTTPIAPTDLGPGEDALLPVPWRVEIELNPPPPAPTGIPTEAFTNASLYGPTNRLVTEMLPAGAWMIDERNGLIYKVAKRDIDPENPDQAILTLDQEIPPAMLDDDPAAGPAGVPPGELIRTVWVFPPAVERQRGADGLPEFIGPQPVVRIDVQVMAFSP